MLCFPDDCGTKKKAPYRHVQTGGLHLLKGENLLGLDDLAVLVETAIGAYAMRKLDLAALRANGTRRCIHAVVSAAAVAVPVYIIDRTAVTDFAYFVNARLCRVCQHLHTRQEWRTVSVTAGDLEKSRKSNEAKCSRQADSSQ